MPFTLANIGGGQQVLQYDAGKDKDGDGSALSDFSRLVGIQKTFSDLAQAPMQQYKLSLETKLKENEVMSIGIDNLMKQAQLNKAIGDENRAFIQSRTQFVKDLVDVYRKDPNAGRALVQQTFPGAVETVNDDGTVTFSVPQGSDGKQGQATFMVDPNARTADERLAQEQKLRDALKSDEAVQRFSVIGTQFKSLQKLINDKTSDPTGQKDLVILNLFNRIIDPTGRVTEGDVLTARARASLGEKLANAITAAAQKGGPIFGDATSPVRKNFLESVRYLYDNEKQNAVMVAKDIADTARREKLDPRNVIFPMGGLSEMELLLDENQLADVATGKLSGKALEAALRGASE